MGEFFRGWCRKIGCVTLFLGLLFMIGWVRSLALYDRISIPSDDSFCFLVSMKGIVAWSKMTGFDLPTGANLAAGPNGVKRWNWDTTPMKVIDQIPISNEGLEYEWQWQWNGFDLGEAKWSTDGPTQSGRFECYSIPYWSITIPLTLISLWLLLSKPRQSIQKKNAEPTPVEGT